MADIHHANIGKKGRAISHYNLGVQRNTSLDIERRWESEVQARLAEQSQKNLVFSYGTNDTHMENGVQRVTFEETVTATHRMLAVARNIGKVLFIGPPTVVDSKHNRRNAELDVLLAEAINDYKIPYISLYQLLQGNQDWLEELKMNDYYHPRANGYELLYRLIADAEFWKFEFATDN